MYIYIYTYVYMYNIVLFYTRKLVLVVPCIFLVPGWRPRPRGAFQVPVDVCRASATTQKTGTFDGLGFRGLGFRVFGAAISTGILLD